MFNKTVLFNESFTTTFPLQIKLQLKSYSYRIFHLKGHSYRLFFSIYSDVQEQEKTITTSTRLLGRCSHQNIVFSQQNKHHTCSRTSWFGDVTSRTSSCMTRLNEFCWKERASASSASSGGSGDAHFASKSFWKNKSGFNWISPGIFAVLNVFALFIALQWAKCSS